MALVLVDVVFSALQHYQLPLDGDLAPIVVPSAPYARVLTDPFGLGALRGEVYAAPNRYFAHLAMVGWCRHVPLALQKLGVPPISSIYVAAALFKTLVQALLLGLLAGYASGTLNPRRRTYWVAAALLAPLFQTLGYQAQLGVIDRSLTYTFFYAWPLALLLVLLWPFYRAARRGEAVRLSPGGTVALTALAVVLALNGPIVTGVVSVLLPGAVLAWALARWRATTGSAFARVRTGLTQLPRAGALVLGALGLLALYSLWIGRQNAENLATTLPLATRYARLAVGIGHLLTAKLGLPLLLAGSGLNAWLLRRRPTPEARGWLTAGRWLLAFAAGYLLLLPLGGYRAYREFVLRYDTALPLTLGLFIFYVGTAVCLLRGLAPRASGRYAVLLVAVALIFVNADRRRWLRPAESNAAERRALTQLAAAPGPVVRLPPGTRVLAWEPITDPRASAVNAALLKYWHVSARPPQYYSAPDTAH